jgi:integrase/recombinase XerD
MNRRPQGSSGNRSSPGSSNCAVRSSSLPLSKALVGFTNAKLAEGLSPRTVDSYLDDLQKWVERTGDREVGKVTGAEITAYLAWLRTEYTPHRFSGKTHPLSPKTIRNVWIAMSALFRWAELELGIPYPMREVRLPRSPAAPVLALTREEVERMLKACVSSRDASTLLRRSFNMRRPTASRDIAVLLVLLDTGLRASELCALKIGDVDLKTGRVEVKHGVQGGAKGGKGRSVYLGKVARRAVWHYISSREDGDQPDAPLFLSRGNREMSRSTVLQLISSLGRRAGVQDAYPHKLRHTFAITYLRSGGDVFTLQQILGHAGLEMVRHYARVAQSDVADAHRRASPVDNWRL